MLEIIIGAIVVFCFFLFIIVIINNKFKFSIIKLEKAEEDIEIYLQKKKDLLDRATPIIKKELKLKEFLTDLELYKDDMTNFEKNDLLKKVYNELLKIIDENEKLYKSESLVAILKDLGDNEENVVGAIRYYNDIVVDYNKLAISFPTNIIAFFKRYKKKEFYNNEKRVMFEILN